MLTDAGNICYNSINYFINCIEKGLNHWGVQTQKTSEIDANMLNQRWDALIGINHFLPSSKTEDGTFYMDFFGCPMFEILVDPPYFHHLILESHVDNLYLIVLDQGHAQYCKTFYAPFKGVETAYLLGPVANCKKYKDREIDVLFMGTYSDIEETKQSISGFCKEKWADIFFDRLIDIRLEYPELTTFQSMLLLQAKNNIHFSNDDLKMVMNTFGAYSDFYVRGYYRQKLITTLVDSGINIHIAGAGWEKLYPTCPHNLVLEGPVSFDQTAVLSANAKISLNIMPWRNGIHDRILTSMMNGSICATNSSTYIDAHFQNNNEIILFDLKKIEILPCKINKLLDNPDLAEKIAHTGQCKVLDNYSWELFVHKYILEPLLQ